MEILIARQPILNQNKRLFAYELLYRGAHKLSMAEVGGERATSSLLTSTFLTKGIEEISGSKPCFINFTEELLTKRIAQTFPKTKMVVEILENVQPTTEVIDACKELKKEGYTIALDDFEFNSKLYPLIELADIIKFDFRLSSIDEIYKSTRYLSHYKLKFLAEKIENHDEFKQAMQLGCSYFQGYFFAKPEQIAIRELSTSKVSLLQLIYEINRKSIKAKRLIEIISADVSLSYKLLRYINSAYFYLISEVTSITHAVSYLGENEIRRFVTLIAISEIAANKPPEIVRLATVRAKFCQELGRKCKVSINPHELFLLGLFSLIHAMLDLPMQEVLHRLPLSDNLKTGLATQKGPLGIFLRIVKAYERGETKLLSKAAEKIGISDEDFYAIYIEAVKYGDNFNAL